MEPKSLFFLFIFLLFSCYVRAQTPSVPQSPCTAEQVNAFRGLVDILKTFPQNESSLYIGVQVIRALPSGLAGNTADLQQAFDAIALMYSQLFNISVHVINGSQAQPQQFFLICTIYNQLSATPLAPFIEIKNLAALLAIVRFGVLNALTPQPAASNFTEAYFKKNAPATVRLALTPGGMVVSWQTLGAYRGRPAVRFGTNKRDLYRQRKGESHTYGTAYFHDVVLKNLRSDRKYYYTIVGDVTRKVYSFTTAPGRYNRKPFVATILGDMGYINAGQTYESVLDLIPKTDLFIHIGDISYADNYFLRPEFDHVDTYEESWNIWQQWMMPITSSVPYMVLPGNHEAACQQFLTYMVCPPQQQNFTAYRHRFRMPSEESGAGNVESMWSSFDYGLAHFVMINTETDFSGAPEGPGTKIESGPFGGGVNPEQLAWLKADLKKANARRHIRPWIIVLGHRPIYTGIVPGTTGGPIDGFSPVIPATFESIMSKYKVDIYFAGHLHFYERLYPIENNVSQHYEGNVYKNPTAPTYIINGAAGNDELHEEVVYNHTIGSYYNNKDFGFGKLYIHNHTHLEWQYIRSADKIVDDDLWIIQEENTRFHPSFQPAPDRDEDTEEYENEDEDD